MNIVIKDLEMNKELDAQAMREVVGGKRSLPRSTQSLCLKGITGKRKWMPQYKRLSGQK